MHSRTAASTWYKLFCCATPVLSAKEKTRIRSYFKLEKEMLNQETNLKQDFQTATDQIISATLIFILKRELGKSAFSFLDFCPQQKSEWFDSMIFHATKTINISATMIRFIVTLICAVIPITGTNTIFFTFHFSNYAEISTTHAKKILP